MTPTWQTPDGAVKLFCADCLDVLPALTPGSVDAVVTDPPYGIQDEPLRLGERGTRRGGDNDYHPRSDWDFAINPEWCKASCRVAPVVAWFGHWRKRAEVEAAMAWPIRAEIIWAKDCHVGPPCPLAMRDERIWLFSKNGIAGRYFETTVWDEPIIPTWEYKEHKNEKPIALMQRIIEWIPADTILDPFMGSGTTGVACVRTGRRFIGVERERKYFDIAVRRIEAELNRFPLFQEEKPMQTAMEFPS